MKILLSVVCLSFLPNLATGAESMEHKKPPREAVEACQDKSDGVACEFKGREGKSVSGTCFRPESSVPFACKPADGPEHL